MAITIPSSLGALQPPGSRTSTVTAVQPIVAGIYAHHAQGGRLILIGAATNTTAGAAMIAAVTPNTVA